VSSFVATRFVAARANATDSMESSTVELEIKVEGMKCGGCSSKVEKALQALDHVKGVQVDLDSKLATVEVEADSLIDAMNMLPGFVTTVKELGFEAEPHIEYQL
jgi:copper chaperone CopZ